MKKWTLAALTLASTCTGAALAQGADVAGLLVIVDGAVHVRRATWRRFSPAGVGTELREGDTILLDAGAGARVLCPDLLSTWRPSPRVESGVFEGCPRTTATIRTRAGQRVLGLRAVQATPAVLMPSNTAILDPTPWIRWLAVPEAKRYTVSLFRNSDRKRPVWGPVASTGTAVRSPASLEPGVDYVVKVEADDGSSSEGRPFTLRSQQRGEIEKRKAAIAAALPTGPARELATAFFLSRQEFRAEALERLDELVTGSESPELQLLRAQCLEEIGAGAAAEAAFERARSAAERQGHTETEAEALLGMSRLVIKRARARALSGQAALLLRELGDIERAKALEAAAAR